MLMSNYFLENVVVNNHINILLALEKGLCLVFGAKVSLW